LNRAGQLIFSPKAFDASGLFLLSGNERPMFTGIIQEVGRVDSLETRGGGRRLIIDAGRLAAKVAVGDSLAIDGVCLTAENIEGQRVKVYASPESLQRTTLGDFRPGRRVNLEQPLRAGEQIGGHFVQGHVDDVGVLRECRRNSEESWELRISLPERLRPLLVEKGSIAIDGISLTIAAVDDSEFRVVVIPQTMKATTLTEKRSGDRMNLEGDILAKQIQQFLSRYARPSSGGVTWDLLEQAGFTE
jgi:riboflavin synthase